LRSRQDLRDLCFHRFDVELLETLAVLEVFTGGIRLGRMLAQRRKVESLGPPKLIVAVCFARAWSSVSSGFCSGEVVTAPSPFAAGREKHLSGDHHDSFFGRRSTSNDHADGGCCVSESAAEAMSFGRDTCRREPPGALIPPSMIRSET
jgi:hypothetical protein